MFARPKTKRRKPRRRCWATCIAATTFGLLAPRSALAEPSSARHVEELSDAMRRRVRGGRPDPETSPSPWQPHAVVPDADAREHLEAFERAAFSPLVPMQTIVEHPPESWMEELELPDLPVRWDDRMVTYLKYFRDHPRGRETITRWMRDAARYAPMLRELLQELEVPEDLLMVALVESGFHPQARSPVGAAGLWQFMPYTGNAYGLHRSYWVDERNDIVRSTRAAALYLKDLYARFGSWELALASYNAGYGAIATTIARHNTNNFWALCRLESGLPYQTTKYVPKIMAVAIVARNLETFGIDTSDVTPLRWGTVYLPYSTNLTVLAQLLGVAPDALTELNAHLIRGRTPPHPRGYQVRIPEHALSRFHAIRPALRAQWRQEKLYRLRQGERLADVADRFGIEEADLLAANGIQDEAELESGQMLVLPSAPPTASSSPTPASPEPRRLAAVPELAVGPGERVVYFVATRGTTPDSLARTFGVSWAQIVAWNDLDPLARLLPDQLLQLVVPASFDASARGLAVLERDEVRLTVRGSAEHITAALAMRGKLRRGYKTRRGETLATVGRRFGLSPGDLARINGFSRHHRLRAGELLVVYVDRARIRNTIAPPPPAYVLTARDTTSDPMTVSVASTPASDAVQADPERPGEHPSRDADEASGDS